MRTDDTNGYYSRILMEIWDMRAWTDQGEGFGDSLKLIQEGMLRRNTHNLMKEFYWSLRWISSVWRSVGTSRRVKELARRYVWVGEAQDQYIEDMKVLITNGNWKSGRGCL